MNLKGVPRSLDGRYMTLSGIGVLTIILQLFRQPLIFLEIAKYSRAVLLRRPGGMHEAGVGGFEGVRDLQNGDWRSRACDLDPARQLLAIRQGRRIHLKALWGGQHRRPAIFDLQYAALNIQN